jgi:tripartite-type tricarboxylate transporter receptor subunit TctC
MAKTTGSSSFIRALGAALALAAAATVQAQPAYPNRAVQIVVPYTPGTGADIISRLLGPRLSEAWKVPVITDNKPGATGNIGSEMVAKANPDGYTLLCVATSFGTNPAINTKLPFDPVKNFTPVAILATSGLAFMVPADLPVKSIKEFIEYAQRQPGVLNYSSPGNGGPQHLAMELFKQEAHIDIVHVPYKGAAGALGDLIGGHVKASVVAIQTAAPHVHSGRLRMLAVMGAERSPAFPGVPTLKESGFPDMVVDTWYGMFAPAGTPAEVVAKLNADLNALLVLPEVREQFAKQGLSAVGGPPARLGDLVKRELPRWAKVVKGAGIKAD